MGTWNGSAYTNITGKVQTGGNGGTWDGNGIVTSMAAAHSPSFLTTIGVAAASDVLGISGQMTRIRSGETVSPTAVLVKYTYGGDANLDGVINGDDYFHIDAGFCAGATGYFNGDFDYNGRVDADDYWLIDSNYNKAGTPLSSMPSVIPARVANDHGFDLTYSTVKIASVKVKDDLVANIVEGTYTGRATWKDRLPPQTPLMVVVR